MLRVNVCVCVMEPGRPRPAMQNRRHPTNENEVNLCPNQRRNDLSEIKGPLLFVWRRPRASLHLNKAALKGRFNFRGYLVGRAVLCTPPPGFKQRRAQE